MNGVEVLGKTQLYTIFSCTNYGGKAKNKACILFYHNRKEILQNKELEYDPSTTQWYDPSELKIQRGQTGQFFNPQDRPITPPRPYGDMKQSK